MPRAAPFTAGPGARERPGWYGTILGGGPEIAPQASDRFPKLRAPILRQPVLCGFLRLNSGCNI